MKRILITAIAVLAIVGTACGSNDNMTQTELADTLGCTDRQIREGFNPGVCVLNGTELTLRVYESQDDIEPIVEAFRLAECKGAMANIKSIHWVTDGAWMVDLEDRAAVADAIHEKLGGQQGSKQVCGV